MKFNVGDRVEVVGAYHTYQHLVGRETTVLSGFKPIKGRPHHETDILGRKGTNLWFWPQHLRLIYDGHEPCSWENSVWRPTEVVSE